MNRTLDALSTDDVAPTTLLFGLIAGLSLGWTGGSVLAGEPVVEYLPLLAIIAAVGAGLLALPADE